MKIKLLILFLLLYLAVEGQVDTTKFITPINGNGFSWKRAYHDSSDRLPRDTFRLAMRDSGSIAWKNGRFWQYSGFKWDSLKASVAASALLTAGDLAPLFTTTETSGAIAFNLTAVTGPVVFGRLFATSGAPSYLTALDSTIIPNLHSQNYYDTRYLQNSGGGALLFTSGLLQTLNTVVALHDNALWNANKWQGFPVSPAAPFDGQSPRFNGSTGTWEWVLSCCEEGGEARPGGSDTFYLVSPIYAVNDSTIAIRYADVDSNGAIHNTDYIYWNAKVGSVTGLNTDNTDPINPVIHISVDGVTITGEGTPASPLIGLAGSSILQQGNKVLTGGIVTYVSGRTFHVGPTTYVIDTTQYSFAGGDVTLAVADPSLDRQDAIILNTSSLADIITGTPAATPSVPTEDAATELILTSAYLAAGASVPSGVGQVVIRDEGSGGEWTISKTLTSTDAYATNPYHLTISQRVTAATGGQYVQWTKPSGTESKLAYSNLVFYMRNNAVLANARNLIVRLFNGTTQVGAAINMTTYGYRKATTGSYMVVGIPMSAFGGADVFNAVRVTNTGTGGTVDWQVDYIQLQSGIGAPPTGGGGSGTLTNITATNNYGQTWTILNPTTSPNLSLILDTTLFSTRLWRQKGVDSLSTLIATKLNITDTTGVWVSNIFRVAGKDSIIYYKGSTRFAVKDSTGGGSQGLQGVITTDPVLTAANTITGANLTQDWQWNTLSNTGFKLSSTSTAAASNNQKVFEIALSGANATSSQTTYGAYFSNTHTGTSPVNYGLFSTASGATFNYGVRGDGTQVGVYGNSVGSFGVGVSGNASGGANAYAAQFGATSSATGIDISTDGGQAIQARVIPSSTNTVVKVITARRSTSGTSANGIGGSINFELQMITGGDRIMNQIISKATDATDATRTSDFIITGVNSAATADLFTLHGNGNLRLNTYGAGTATFDASGNITSVSDERLKNINGYFIGGLDEIANIKPIIYNWNNLSGLEMEHMYIGFSAQNIRDVLGDNAVGINSQGYLSIQDRAIMAAMVNAIKELKTRIEKLEK